MKRALAGNRPFKAALAISTLFHLSMVSVFSIVLWFPRHDVHYYPVDIVQQYAAALPHLAKRDPGAVRGRLRVPSPGRMMEEAGALAPIGEEGGGLLKVAASEGLAVSGDPLAEADPDDSWAGLPPIELPRLEFADLDRLRTREESLRIRSQFSEVFEGRPEDSWAAFSRRLRGLSGALTRWTSPREALPQHGPMRVSSPAAGFAFYIEWMSSPRDRELLFSPPIRALWGVDAARFAEPAAFVFTVSPQGKVTEVQVPVEDEEGITDSIGGALARYRFEPLQGEDARDQIGTLLLVGESPQL